jgi:hypothetical protein
MSYASSNPYVLNLVPLFNVAGSAAGGATIEDLNTTVLQLSNYFDTATNTLRVDAIEPYTDGTTITITGNVNIVGELDINGVPVGADPLSGTNTVSGSNIVFETTGSIMNFSSNGNTSFYTNSSANSTTNFYISSSTFRADRAAIGTNGSSALSTIFDVWNGNAYFDRNVFVRSNVYCQNLFQVSDERLKSNTRGFTGGALSTLMELRGVRYDMGGNPHIGFLAQEVEQVVPEAVSWENPAVLTIDYSSFIPLIVEAIKELASCRMLTS